MAVTESFETVKVPYSEVAAYNEYLGRSTYVDGSYGDQSTLFTILWDEGGFTGQGWKATNYSGPLDTWEETDLANITNDDISGAIASWPSRVTNPIDRLNWMFYFANYGCVR